MNKKSKKNIKNLRKKTQKAGQFMNTKKNNLSSEQTMLNNLIDNYKGTKGRLIEIKDLPSFELVNRPSSTLAKIYLKNGESVICSAGSMVMMDPSIKTETKAQGGIGSAFLRSLFTNASMFMTKYSATKDNSLLAVNDFLPGDILPIIIKPGTSHNITQKGLICYTPNLEIKTKFNLKNFVMSEGFGQIQMINNSNVNAMVWIAAYGGFTKIELKEGEEKNIDNGYFLESDSSIDYKVTSSGSLKTTILGGEGLLMKYKGPAKFYIKSRNLDAFEAFIQINAQ